MKAKPKKKKSKDKPPPSSPIPPELKKLVPDHPDISFRDLLVTLKIRWHYRLAINPR